MTDDEIIEHLERYKKLLYQAIQKVKDGELKNIKEADVWLESMGYSKKSSEDILILAKHRGDQLNAGAYSGTFK